MASVVQTGNRRIKASLVGSLDSCGSMCSEVHQNLDFLPVSGLPRRVCQFRSLSCIMEEDVV